MQFSENTEDSQKKENVYQCFPCEIEEFTNLANLISSLTVIHFTISKII